MKLFVGYSKAPEQPQGSARPICQSHTMTSTGREPATIHIAAYRSSPHYAFTPRQKTDNVVVQGVLGMRSGSQWSRTKRERPKVERCEKSFHYPECLYQD